MACGSNTTTLPSPASGRGAGGEGDSLLDRAKRLRSTPTEAEARLWYYLRAHRLGGLKFKRQKPLGPYIIDFVCMEHQLIVEVDGGQHADTLGYDAKREAWLAARGFRVLRFWNNEVLGETEAVLDRILQTLALSPSPSPMHGRGE